jgi:hypothetical protein
MSSVAPYVVPPVTPAPASRTVWAKGQWSRPACGLIRGVRPNSLIMSSSVSWNNPRPARSATRAERPRSNGGSLAKVPIGAVVEGGLFEAARPWVAGPAGQRRGVELPGVGRRGGSWLICFLRCAARLNGGACDPEPPSCGGAQSIRKWLPCNDDSSRTRLPVNSRAARFEC